MVLQLVVNGRRLREPLIKRGDRIRTLRYMGSDKVEVHVIRRDPGYFRHMAELKKKGMKKGGKKKGARRAA